MSDLADEAFAIAQLYASAMYGAECKLHFTHRRSYPWITMHAPTKTACRDVWNKTIPLEDIPMWIDGAAKKMGIPRRQPG